VPRSEATLGTQTNYTFAQTGQITLQKTTILPSTNRITHLVQLWIRCCLNHSSPLPPTLEPCRTDGWFACGEDSASSRRNHLRRRIANFPHRKSGTLYIKCCNNSLMRQKPIHEGNALFFFLI